MKTIEKLSRRELRYFCFRKRTELETEKLDDIMDGDEVVKCTTVNAPSNKKAQAVIKHFEDQKGFDGWENFGITWDLGIDDIETMVLRPAKWWCFAIRRLRVVVRQEGMLDDMAVAVKFWKGNNLFKDSVTTSDLINAVTTPDLVTSKLNFTKMMKNIEDRKEWQL